MRQKLGGIEELVTELSEPELTNLSHLIDFELQERDIASRARSLGDPAKNQSQTPACQAKIAENGKPQQPGVCASCRGCGKPIPPYSVYRSLFCDHCKRALFD